MIARVVGYSPQPSECPAWFEACPSHTRAAWREPAPANHRRQPAEPLDPADVARAAALVQGSVEAHVVPELTHVLRRGPPKLLQQHRLLAGPVDERVLDLVSAWIRKISVDR